MRKVVTPEHIRLGIKKEDYEQIKSILSKIKERLGKEVLENMLTNDFYMKGFEDGLMYVKGFNKAISQYNRHNKN